MSSLASCGFPRPADVLPPDAGSDGGTGSCTRDEDCHDPARPFCVSSQCFAAADACREGGGARILFLSNRDGNSEVWRAYANGSTPVRLTSYDPPQSTSFVAPSPDAKDIAFIHQSDVFVMSWDGSNATNITMSATLEDRLEWSPDGKMLAVGTTDGAGNKGAYFMVKDGSALAQLTGVGPSRDPSWWPDSSKVVFASTAPSETDIYEKPVSPPGQGAQALIQLQSMGARFSEPHVAPGVFAIAFLLDDHAMVAPTFGGAAQPLTTAAVNDHEIAWSHDSSKVLVVRGNGTDRAIWVVNADGSGLKNLAPGSRPRWSPDDRYILFDTDRDGNREVYRMDSNGANQVNLSKTPYDDFGGEWLSCAP